MNKNLLALLLVGTVLGAGEAGVNIVQRDGGGWILQVDGKPFPIRGVGGSSHLELLKASGGNALRTWGIQDLEKQVDGKRLIDRAHELGLKVVPGLWIGHERHGFRYDDAAMVRKQRDEVRAAVRKWKDHPAVLMWGLGNEMEGVTSATGSEAVYKEIEELTKLVKAEDARHPVMSVIAWNPGKVPALLQHCPSLDVLGVNSYGAASGAPEALKRAGWKKPFAVTEFGVPGPWEVGTTTWGAPQEPTSTEKARTFFATHRMVTELNDGKELCLGTFAFVWGAKQERTATWFGMFLDSGEKLPQVDAMVKAWTGAWPGNRCPTIERLVSPAAAQTVKPGIEMTATLTVKDPEADPLRFAWEVAAESTDIKTGGDAESRPKSFPELILAGTTAECRFATPKQPGAYRLFVTVFDGKSGAATANIPFRVE
jgi:hypothetical protein